MLRAIINFYAGHVHSLACSGNSRDSYKSMILTLA